MNWRRWWSGQNWIRRVLRALGLGRQTAPPSPDETQTKASLPEYFLGTPSLTKLAAFRTGQAVSCPTEDLYPPSELLLDRHGLLDWPYQLFPYQVEGVMALLTRPALLLADDMGLGKTLQAIAALRTMAHQKRLERALVVCPASLVMQWRRELRKTAPELRVVTVEGMVSERAWQWPAPAHIIIVSYETLRQDITEDPRCPPRRHTWDVIVLDEAQKIKNRDSEISRRVKTLPRRKAWALTGTPLENRVDDLASILEFTRPMNSSDEVLHVYPGTKMTELHARLQLRRRKAEVLPQLPPKLVSTVPLVLSGEQRTAYDRAEREGIWELRQKGEAVKIQNVLELIIRLKQLCNFAPRVDQSAKMADLRERIATLVAGGHKAIVYSQFVDDRFGVGRIAHLLAEFKPLVYTGQLDAPAKARVVEQFKTDQTRPVLILSLRAGGLGLNLQEATYAFHFDRWWNPAVETQADDRIHRIGQAAAVNIYRYVCADTIEERIDELLAQKRQLFDDIVDDISLSLKQRLTEKELYALFGLAPPGRGASR